MTKRVALHNRAACFVHASGCFFECLGRLNAANNNCAVSNSLRT